MDPITLCAHINLLIALAIRSDLCIVDSALYFCILCLQLTPCIGLCFPTSGEIWASAKLVSQALNSPRTLSSPHGRAHNHAIICYFVCHHFNCQRSTKFELGGWGILPRTGSAHDSIGFNHGANESELSSGSPLCVPNLLQTLQIDSGLVGGLQI